MAKYWLQRLPAVIVIAVLAVSTARAQVREYLNSPAAAAETAESRAVLQHVASQLESLGQAPPGRYCGSSLIDYIHSHREQLSAGARAAITAALPGALVRPGYTNPEFYDNPDVPFRIHFTRTGADSVRNASTDTAADGVPTYVHVVSAALTRAYQLLVDSIGFTPPLSDSGAGGGQGLYDCYLANTGGSNIIAYTAPETYYYRIFNLVDTVLVATSYQVVDATMETFTGDPGQLANPFDLVRTTCPHEFFHAFHYSLDVREKPSWQLYSWWLEGNASWFEDLAYPDINDWQYIGPYMKRPWQSLMVTRDAFDVHVYGGGQLWSFYLAERYGGPTIMRKIWEQCGRLPGDNTLEAIADSLAPFGVTLDQAWAEFTEWCMHTGDSWDPDGFAQGAMWPEPTPVASYFRYPQVTHVTTGTDTLANAVDPALPTSTLVYDSIPLQGMAFLPVEYIPFLTRSDSMTFFAAGEDGMPVSFYYTGIDHTVYPNRVRTVPFPAGTTQALPDWLHYDRLSLVAVAGPHFDSLADYPSAGDTTLIIDSSMAVIIAALDTSLVAEDNVTFTPPSPNPVQPDRGEAARFDVVLTAPQTIYLDIFSMSGDLVRSIKRDNAIAAVNVFWDGTNDAGQRVASGLYLCKLTAGTSEKVYRVGIVR